MLLINSITTDDHLEWCDFVKSKIRYLVDNLERNQHIILTHVNPQCFERSKQQPTLNRSKVDANDKLITAAFCSMYFIGMKFQKTKTLNVNLTENIQNFTSLVHKHATKSNLQKEGMEIEVRHVSVTQLSLYLDKDIVNHERKSVDGDAFTTTTTTTNPAASAAGNKKRISTETAAPSKNQTQTQLDQIESTQTTKRQKTNEHVSKLRRNCE